MIAVWTGFGELEEVLQQVKSVEVLSGVDMGPAGHVC